MLQELSDQSKRWYIKALLVFLVLSFCMLGVADIFMSYINMRPVASVNSHNITQEEFGSRLQNMVARAQEAAKGQLDAARIREMGIAQKVLDSLVDQTLIREEAARFRLMVTDAAVKRRIQGMPLFLNEQGNFDKRAFDHILQNNQIPENRFIADIRAEEETRQLFSALTASMRLPKTYVDLLFRGFFEQRVFAYAIVPFNKMVVKDSPKNEELEKFYHTHQSRFMLPELRKITLLELDPAVLKEQIKVTEEKLLEEYDRRKAEFEVAEKRDVKQVSFRQESAAVKAAGSLRKGHPVPAAARDEGGENKDLGWVTKQQLPESVADKIFEAVQGQVLEPVSTPFEWQVYSIAMIKPAFTKSFQDVRAQLEADLKTQLASDQLYDLKIKVEDELASGASLSEIAKRHHLNVRVIDGISQSGMDQDNVPVLTPGDRRLILEQAFSISEGMDSPVIDGRDGLSWVIHVDAIKPSHVPAFSAVKDKVLKAWIHNRQFDLAMIVAQQLAKDARSVSDLSRLGAGRKLPMKVLSPLSRVDAEKDDRIREQFTPELVHQMFELKLGKAVLGVMPGLDNGGIQVVMLQQVLPLNDAALSEKRSQMEKALNSMVLQDAQELYIKSLRKTARISINKEIYNAMANRE